MLYKQARSEMIATISNTASSQLIKNQLPVTLLQIYYISRYDTCMRSNQASNKQTTCMNDTINFVYFDIYSFCDTVTQDLTQAIQQLATCHKCDSRRPYSKKRDSHRSYSDPHICKMKAELIPSNLFIRCLYMYACLYTQ